MFVMIVYQECSFYPLPNNPMKQKTSKYTKEEIKQKITPYDAINLWILTSFAEEQQKDRSPIARMIDSQIWYMWITYQDAVDMFNELYENNIPDYLLQLLEETLSPTSALWNNYQERCNDGYMIYIAH